MGTVGPFMNFMKQEIELSEPLFSLVKSVDWVGQKIFDMYTTTSPFHNHPEFGNQLHPTVLFNLDMASQFPPVEQATQLIHSRNEI